MLHPTRHLSARVNIGLQVSVRENSPAVPRVHGSATTWTKFSGSVPGDNLGGGIAVADHSKIMMIIGNGGPLVGTQDGGAHWAQCAGTAGATFSGAYYGRWHNVAADRVNIGTFYAVSVNNRTHQLLVWKSTDGGATCTNVFAGKITASTEVLGNTELKAAPGNAGHLWLAADEAAYNNANYFSRSTNGGRSWINITAANGYCGTFTGVEAFGFGATAPGAGYPTMWVLGFKNHEKSYNLYRSTDGMVTCTKITSQPDTSNYRSIVNGDMNDPNVVYQAYGAFGVFRGTLH